MTPFGRPGRERINPQLVSEGRGWIRAALFDVGIYAAAIPDSDGCVVGEVHRMTDPAGVLSVLDEIEGYRPSEPQASLYRRVETDVNVEGRDAATAWVYFYNAPLGRAPRIESGNYLEYLMVK